MPHTVSPEESLETPISPEDVSEAWLSHALQFECQLIDCKPLGACFSGASVARVRVLKGGEERTYVLKLMDLRSTGVEDNARDLATRGIMLVHGYTCHGMLQREELFYSKLAPALTRCGVTLPHCYHTRSSGRVASTWAQLLFDRRHRMRAATILEDLSASQL